MIRLFLLVYHSSRDPYNLKYSKILHAYLRRLLYIVVPTQSLTPAIQVSVQFGMQDMHLCSQDQIQLSIWNAKNSLLRSVTKGLLMHMLMHAYDCARQGKHNCCRKINCRSDCFLAVQLNNVDKTWGM